MLTESEEYWLLDALNTELSAITVIADPNPFALLTIDFFRDRISQLPQTRIDTLKSIAETLSTAENAIRSEAINGKKRLIKADVLEWSDKAELSSTRVIGELQSSLTTKIRMILGLDSIALMLEKFKLNGVGNNYQARLYRG